MSERWHMEVRYGECIAMGSHIVGCSLPGLFSAVPEGGKGDKERGEECRSGRSRCIVDGYLLS
ncbi:MAG: hypothetical protein WC107_00760 [Patescibacteria group bacterium]